MAGDGKPGDGTKPLTAPDGAPSSRGKHEEGTRKSRVSEVQDPLISGDAKKDEAPAVANEASVDEAGQLQPKDKSADLLH